MGYNHSFAFLVSTRPGLKRKTSNIIKSLDKDLSDRSDKLLDKLHGAIRQSGLMGTSVAIVLRVMNAVEFNHFGEELNRANSADTPMVDYTEIGHTPRKFEHERIKMYTMYFDSDDVEFIDRINDARNLVGIDISDVVNDYKGYSILLINVSEEYIASMYDTYYVHHGTELLIYDLSLVAIDGIIPTYSIDLVAKSINGCVLDYNKYALEVLTSTIASTISAKFNICATLNRDDNESEQVRSCIVFRRSIANLAKSATDEKCSWMGQGDLEAYIGAICGIGIASRCIPCIHALNDSLPDAEARRIIAIYYESVSEIMDMVVGMVNNYIFGVAARNSSELYIGRTIPDDEIRNLSFKLREIKAKHKRTLKCGGRLPESNQYDAVDMDTLLQSMYELVRGSGNVDDIDDILADIGEVTACYNKCDYSECDLESAVTEMINNGKLKTLANLSDDKLGELLRTVRYTTELELCDNDDSKTNWMMASKLFLSMYMNGR